MKKRIIILVYLWGCFLCNVYAEIKILSTSAWSPTITGSWKNSGGLEYSNTVYGDSYYNADWQDMSKQSSIQVKTVYRTFNLRPDSKRNWTFSMPISNLNAEKGYSYSSKNNPKKKQSSDQIYWAIRIGYKENGVSRTSTIWIKRSQYTPPTYGVYESIYNGRLIQYCIDNEGWKESSEYYPSCSPKDAPSLRIETYSWGKTYVKWGNWSITDFPVYMEELSYINISVGTQANILIGKPSAYGEGVNTNNIYDASDLIQQYNYTAAKQKLYRFDESYYEGPAYNLAWCYFMLNEYDNAIKMCNALVKYNGETLQRAYAVRGMAKEMKEDYLSALDDYKKAGEIAVEFYESLYDLIYRSNSNQQQQQQQHQRQQANKKPKLTK